MDKLLIVDDDNELRMLLAQVLRRFGFDVLMLADSNGLDDAIGRYNPALVVLDRMLPSGDGAVALRKLRERSENIPVILLTGRDETPDRIIGLNAGADDYVSKPFDPQELLARIQAVLRRKSGSSLASRVVQFGPFIFNLQNGQLHKDGQLQELTTSEQALLEALVTHPNRKLSREQLLSLTRDGIGSNGEATDRAVDVAIFRLRRIVEVDPKRPRHIRTVWGVGYTFVPDGGPA
jgi:two-component system phosphate regulon response regulator OmpR